MHEPKNLREMRNLGRASEAMLFAAGIRTPRTLDEVGAVEAYQRVVDAGEDPSLNLLWALDAALLGIDWRSLPEERKAELLAALDGRTVRDRGARTRR